MRLLIAKFLYGRIPSNTETEYHEILLDYSTYYRRLEPLLQKRFRLRLFILLNVLSFSSAHIPTINREMRAVIGSAIIEITFGLKNFLPSRFLRVIVMPRRYMYPGYGQPFLGHVDNNANTVYFSWEDVKHGYQVPDDALNVALHEMAHVLEHENSFYFLFNSFFKDVNWNEWAELAFNKMQIIRSEQNQFLKSYGGVNMSEMFAVCVEAFFEKPRSFKKNLPELYLTLVRLLKQDPSIQGNPLLNR